MSTAVPAPPAPRPPVAMRRALSEITADPRMGSAVKALLGRRFEMGGRLRATLAGAAAEPSARAHLDRAMDDHWRLRRPPRQADEVVVGAGLHAAIYCAVRVEMGFPRPLVLEASERVGGAMAWSRRAGFYLNSRNRPGRLGAPGAGGALNYLPGAPVQPSDLSADEYQRNTDVAFVVRTTLMMSADVVTGARVVAVERASTSKAPDRLAVDLEDGSSIEASRVVYCCGLGEPLVEFDGSAVVTFAGLMERMDSDFPLRGLDRVAVVGAGDSGKTAVEALAGQGPAGHLSVASLDSVAGIDWYGVPADRRKRTSWETCNRSRYKGIGRLLPRLPDGRSLVVPLDRATAVAPGHREGYVNNRPYDLVVDCRGFAYSAPDDFEYAPYPVGGRPVAARAISVGEVYRAGPCAQLALAPSERDLAAVPENANALFRYAGRTAALAASLPGKKRERRKPARKKATRRNYARDVDAVADRAIRRYEAESISRARRGRR